MFGSPAPFAAARLRLLVPLFFGRPSSTPPPPSRILSLTRLIFPPCTKPTKRNRKKKNRGGAAATLGAARVLAGTQPAGVEVHFIVASCENMVGGKGLRPGDILTSAKGKTVEINNTDAGESFIICSERGGRVGREGGARAPLDSACPQICFSRPFRLSTNLFFPSIPLVHKFVFPVHSACPNLFFPSIPLVQICFSRPFLLSKFVFSSHLRRTSAASLRS